MEERIKQLTVLHYSFSFIEWFLSAIALSLSSIDGNNYNEYARILSTGVTGHGQKLKGNVVTIENLESNISCVCVHPRYMPI